MKSHFITAYCYRKYDRFTVCVPILLDDAVPEVPRVVRVDSEFFVLQTSEPLSYSVSTFAEVERLK